MKKERIDALAAVLLIGRATNSRKVVSVSNANLCGESIMSLSKIVEVSSQLQTLFINHNRIENRESALHLSRSLKSHISIKHLYLAHCDLGSTPEILLVVLQSDVKYIDLSKNSIDSLGAVKIADYLGADPPIKSINLAHNRLNDDDAILISQALTRNTNLETIHLYINNFTSIGVKTLLNCVYDNSSLNATLESNHTLNNLKMFNCPNNLDGCIDRLLVLDRTQKILLALQDKDALLKYLANVPVELIPEVLAFPLFVVDQPQHKFLNVVYSTMRWWNMPSLYSYHRRCAKSDAKRRRKG
jgi:hypothetical protein